MYFTEHDQETAERQYEGDEVATAIPKLLQQDQEDPEPASHAKNIYHVFVVKQAPAPEAEQPPMTEPEPQSQEPAAPQPQRQFPALVVTLCIIGMALVTGTGAALLTPLWLQPSVTVTIIPAQRTITTTTPVTLAMHPQPGKNQLQARQLPTFTLSQEQTIRTTGTGYQQATAAHGYMTFYNAALIVQVIPAGTLVTGADGVQVVTDEDASIPAGSLSNGYGRITVPAHAIQTGPQGNIAAGDISGSCCRVNVFARNNAAFTGGQDAHDFPMVTKQDIANTAASLTASLQQSIQAAYQAELHATDGLTPPTCRASQRSDHPVGSEATTVTVTLSETCSAFAYDLQAMQQQLTAVQTQQARKQLGTGYLLTGAVHMHIIRTDTTKNQPGTLLLTIQAQGVWVYQFDQWQLDQMRNELTGKTKEQATAILFHLPGVQQVSLGNEATLPTDPGKIYIAVSYEAIS